MEEFDFRAQRLAALCLLGVALFSYPLLAIFNAPERIFGIPLLYVYFFAAWAALIALMAFAVEGRD
jgi:hypothetical protein